MELDYLVLLGLLAMLGYLAVLGYLAALGYLEILGYLAVLAYLEVQGYLVLLATTSLACSSVGAAIFPHFHPFTLSPLKGASHFFTFSPFHFFTFKRLFTIYKKSAPPEGENAPFTKI